MAWREQLQPASFRGVPFYVYTSSGEVGRRNVVHEYPLRDT
ncbi:DNA circularization N-terminal domain-containing protein, partial [uncultured Deefgea sp.]